MVWPRSRWVAEDLKGNRSMRILVFATHYLPGYKGGGPIKTIKNLLDRADSELTFKLITDDRDLGDSQPYSTVECGAWNQIGKASVFYVKRGVRGCCQVAKIVAQGNHDIVYLNSFFSLRFSFFPLLLAKLLRQRVILGPRGELSEGALSIKPITKSIFIFLYNLLRLYRGVIFQASTGFEAADIRRNFGSKVDVLIAEDIGTQKFTKAYSYRSEGPLRAVFISRISPMKNLLLALEILLKVKMPVSYHIYGPIEDHQYWEQCQKIIGALPAHIEVEYKGELNPECVINTMSEYDVFFMPTKGENYSHVITEALCAALPLVIADTTPWKNLQESRIGWDLSLNDPDAFRTVLDELASMPVDQYEEMRERVLVWAKDKFSQRDAIEANMAMFRDVYEKN